MWAVEALYPARQGAVDGVPGRFRGGPPPENQGRGKGVNTEYVGDVHGWASAHGA